MNPQPSTLNYASRRSATKADQPAVHLHIERLVIDGLPLDQGELPLLLAAMEDELTRLLAGPRLLALSGGAWASAAAQPISWGRPGSPARTGKSLGQAVYQAVTATCSPPSDQSLVGGDRRETSTVNPLQGTIKP